jgi:hypothetical protein
VSLPLVRGKMTLLATGEKIPAFKQKKKKKRKENLSL